MNVRIFERRNATADLMYWILGIFILTVTFIFRIYSYNIITSDYSVFLNQWFQILATHSGLSAFQAPFADYPPLYLYFIKILTFIPISSLYSIKTLSFLFDIIVAILSCLILKQLRSQDFNLAKLFFAFAVILSIPTIVINSSLWAQCDSWYTAGILATLYFIIRDRPIYAVVVFSLALSLKLQVIFFIPVLVGYLLIKRRVFWSLSLIPIIFLLSIVPAIINGGSFSYWGLIYMKQATMFSSLNMSSASLFSFFSSVSEKTEHILSGAGTLMAGSVSLAIIGNMFYFNRIKKISDHKLLLISIASVLFIPYTLPHMHERYFYLADVLSTIYAFYNPYRWYLPMLIVSASFLSYMPYLSEFVPLFKPWMVDLRIPSVLFLIAGIFIIYFIIKEEPTPTFQ